MPPLQIFEAQLTAVNQASQPFLIPADKVVLDFDFDVTVLATVEWFLEFTGDDPNNAAQGTTVWAREVAEEDIGAGVVHMPIVIRDFSALAVGNLAAGTAQARDAQFVRTHKFCRVQIRASAGTVTRARIRAQFGSIPASP